VEEALHHSRMLGLMDQILHDPRTHLRAIEIVGRGIAAEARCHLSMLVDDKRPNNEPHDVVVRRAAALADRVEEWCAIEDDLAAAWRERCADTLDEASLEQVLLAVVERLESWRPEI
jgi:hypothetical protein